MSGFATARTRQSSSHRIPLEDKARVRVAAELELRRRKLEQTETLEGTKREEAERGRVLYYQTHPLDYAVDRLRIQRGTIEWSSLPEYKKHKWDADIDPLLQVLNAVAESKWVGVESGV